MRLRYRPFNPVQMPGFGDAEPPDGYCPECGQHVEDCECCSECHKQECCCVDEDCRPASIGIRGER